MKSKLTKRYNLGYRICAILSFLFLVGPLVAYIIIGMSVADVGAKLILTSTAVAAVILTMISVLTKHAARSSVFVVLLGLAFALNSIYSCLVTIAIANIIDELILTPLKNNFKSKYIIHKEIDKR